jgi:hypothetical protein
VLEEALRLTLKKVEVIDRLGRGGALALRFLEKAQVEGDLCTAGRRHPRPAFQGSVIVRCNDGSISVGRCFLSAIGGLGVGLGR